jgi:hypothetical protein
MRYEVRFIDWEGEDHYADAEGAPTEAANPNAMHRAVLDWCDVHGVMVREIYVGKAL